MIKRISVQISIGQNSIVSDGSPLLLINSKEREINICIATSKICRESGEGECGGKNKQINKQKLVEKQELK